MIRLPPAFEYPLQNNQRALLRWVREGDAPRFAAGFEALSDTSRFSRFFDHLNRLSPAQIAYFTQIDYVDHMAWGALDLDRPSLPGLGVGRYIRYGTSPTVADFALTVADPAQGSGVGTALMAALHLSAAEAGIQQFSCDVLDSNDAFVQRLYRLGAERVGHEDGVITLHMPVYHGPDAVPSGNRSADVFRQVFERLQASSLFRGVVGTRAPN